MLKTIQRKINTHIFKVVEMNLTANMLVETVESINQ